LSEDEPDIKADCCPKSIGEDKKKINIKNTLSVSSVQQYHSYNNVALEGDQECKFFGIICVIWLIMLLSG
jgi:hypothetical protein